MSDLAPLAPSSVQVIFGGNGGHQKNVTLTSLSLSQYAGVENNSGTQIILSSFFYDGTNAAALDTAATQIATDFYLWQLAKLDMVFPFLTNWTPEGTSDSIEWCSFGAADDSDTMCSTRVQRANHHTYSDPVDEDTGGGGGSNIVTAEWTTSEILVINPTSKIEFDIGIDASQGLLTNIGGGVARYRPWSLTVEDLIPTTELRTTTIQFGTNFIITQPSANTTRVDFGLTADDLIGDTVTLVQHMTFGSGFTVTVNGTTGHAFIGFSGSAYSLTVQDEVSWVAPLTGVTVTFPQTPADGGHSLVSIGGCTDLQALYPLFVLHDNSITTTAHLHILCAEQLYSGYVDHGENNSGVQDFAGVKNFHNPTLGSTDPDNYVTINGLSNITYKPGSSNDSPSVLFTGQGGYGGATAVVNGGALSYASVAADNAFLSLACENQDTDSNYLYVSAGPDRAATTDGDGLQKAVVGVDGPFWTTWHPSLGNLCKTWSNDYGSLLQPDDEEANNTYFHGGNVFYPVQNTACTFRFIGGLFRDGYWSRPFAESPTFVPGNPTPQWDWGQWRLLGQNDPRQANKIGWQTVDSSVQYDAGFWASMFGGSLIAIRAILGGLGITATPSASPRPANDFLPLGEVMDLIVTCFLSAGGPGTGSGITGSATHSIPLAALSLTGTQGSIQIRNGQIIAYVDPT